MPVGREAAGEGGSAAAEAGGGADGDRRARGGAAHGAAAHSCGRWRNRTPARAAGEGALAIISSQSLASHAMPQGIGATIVRSPAARRRDVAPDGALPLALSA